MKQLRTPILNVLDRINNIYPDQEIFKDKTLLDVIIYVLIRVDEIKVHEAANILELSEATIYRRMRAISPR